MLEPDAGEAVETPASAIPDGEHTLPIRRADG